MGLPHPSSFLMVTNPLKSVSKTIVWLLIGYKKNYFIWLSRLCTSSVTKIKTQWDIDYLFSFSVWSILSELLETELVVFCHSCIKKITTDTFTDSCQLLCLNNEFAFLNRFFRNMKIKKRWHEDMFNINNNSHARIYFRK